jgi:hypothetical protein
MFLENSVYCFPVFYHRRTGYIEKTVVAKNCNFFCMGSSLLGVVIITECQATGAYSSVGLIGVKASVDCL